jgi:hypothetical protein
MPVDVRMVVVVFVPRGDISYRARGEVFWADWGCWIGRLNGRFLRSELRWRRWDGRGHFGLEGRCVGRVVMVLLACEAAVGEREACTVDRRSGRCRHVIMRWRISPFQTKRMNAGFLVPLVPLVHSLLSKCCSLIEYQFPSIHYVWLVFSS